MVGPSSVGIGRQPEEVGLPRSVTQRAGLYVRRVPIDKLGLRFTT